MFLILLLHMAQLLFVCLDVVFAELLAFVLLAVVLRWSDVGESAQNLVAQA